MYSYDSHSYNFERRIIFVCTREIQNYLYFTLQDQCILKFLLHQSTTYTTFVLFLLYKIIYEAKCVCGYMLSLHNVFICLVVIVNPWMTKKCLSNYGNKRSFCGLYRCVSVWNINSVLNGIRSKS